jgi:hypothetical protein
MGPKQKALSRLAELLAEASQLLKLLAEDEGSTGPADQAPARENDVAHQFVAVAKPEGNDRPAAENGTDRGVTGELLKAKGITIRNVGLVPSEAEGLLTLAGLMGRKFRTVKPLLDQIKRAQSSRRAISIDLSKLPQDAVADITLVANLANRAGLLPNYRYLKSPRYKLFSDAPVSPLAINFFTGQWLELYALKTVRETSTKYGLDLCPLSHVQVELPNNDQFDLDLVCTLGSRIVWVEAKTSDDFERFLPKYKAVSSLICESPRDAILLWSSYESSDTILSARGVLARMTLCAPDEFPVYIAHLVGAAMQPGEDDRELA